MKQYVQSQDLHAEVMHIAHHAFFKQNSVIENESLYFVKQEHGNRVINYNDYPHAVVNADAIVTNAINITLGVKTADCAPVVFVDPVAYIVGIAHAGWRGVKDGIIPNTIDAMIKIGASKQNIIAAIGPCIRQESYEVSDDFREYFPDDDLFIDSRLAGHYMFDLPACIKKQLIDIKAVYDCQIDTYSRSKDFASYRRSQHKRQKIGLHNISTIKLTNSLEGMNEWEKCVLNVKKNNQNKKVCAHKIIESPTLSISRNHTSNEEAQLVLDLHGYTQDTAYEALAKFIKQNYINKNRELLVITGKGSGVIQTCVYKWLQHSEVSKYVLHFQYASQKHGGEGALQVLLKKV